ncbi:MAG: amidohydrolase family protein, partial [Defluviitaleaceae bacterium]|nr:amidohydrolase family protein [Defluviitaleaceae bacterium]
MNILLKNPTIADGVSPAVYTADILISGNLIADICPNINENANFQPIGRQVAAVLDLTGLHVTPGFIDAHSHDDCVYGDHKLRQGITTEITGNCGLGYYPMDNGMEKYLRAAGLPVDAAEKPAAGPVTKRAALVPHSNIRHVSGGDIRRMVKMLETGMERGAAGMSAGLYAPPGSLADADELLRLCAVISRRGGIFAVHLRDEFEIDQSIDECVGLADKTGVRLQISHIKAVGVNKGRARKIIEKIEAARSRGIEITADCYPYTASMTGLAVLAPDYAANIARRGGAEKIFIGSLSLARL